VTQRKRETQENQRDVLPQLDTEHLTEEVGSEGGSPGDLEMSHSETGTGSDAGELWRPAEQTTVELPRGDNPPGRITP